MRQASVSEIRGWGYEGKTVDDLIDSAHSWDVGTVVDIRLNPISRKPGFSKRRLAEALLASGIDYLHLPELGNPRDNRAGFADLNGPQGRDARDRYRDEVLDTATAHTALETIRSLHRANSVVLLCFEASEHHCHRSLVLHELAREWSERASA